VSGSTTFVESRWRLCSHHEYLGGSTCVGADCSSVGVDAPNFPRNVLGIISILLIPRIGRTYRWYWLTLYVDSFSTSFESHVYTRPPTQGPKLSLGLGESATTAAALTLTDAHWRALTRHWRGGGCFIAAAWGVSAAQALPPSTHIVGSWIELRGHFGS
jgi:hypothetical protein